MNNTFISIEGNIGSGKSTILKIIKQNFPELTILDEPLASWEKVGQNGDVNLLKLYYNNPERWGFTFQIYAFMTRLMKWKEFSQLNSQDIKISERSLLSDRFIFASIMKDMNILSEAEHEVYLTCYKNLLNMQKIPKVQGVLYVQCDPKICSQRIKKRSREGEGQIPLDYLQKLHEKHEQWLNPATKGRQSTEDSTSENSQESSVECEENNEIKQEQKGLASCQSISMTDQKVLIIDNRVPIDKNRVINEVREWLAQFTVTQ